MGEDRGGRDESANVEVLAVLRHEQQTITAVQIVAGEARSDSTLIAEETGDRWRVRGFGFTPAEAWADGRRALTLDPCDDAC